MMRLYWVQHPSSGININPQTVNMKTPDPGKDHHLATVIHRLLMLVLVLVLIIGGLIYMLVFGAPHLEVERAERSADAFSPPVSPVVITPKVWTAPDTVTMAGNNNAEQIRYGRDLIANTARYFGPEGSVSHSSNGMNCQNCHLDAGTKPFGNNYSGVASTYPKFRERSGKTESISKRVNDCFERSLNGKAVDTTSKEMKAILAYMHWLGTGVKKGAKPAGCGIEDIAMLDRPADAEKGKNIFNAKCISCHGADGQGKKNADGIAYQYPPLWGAHSYNTGAGLYRLTRFAGYVKNNMPWGASKETPQLSNEEAWDVAAYVNSQPRPSGKIDKDWPRLAAKPIDNPFGPYVDPFTEQQHKYGPYGPITAWVKKQRQEAENSGRRQGQEAAVNKKEKNGKTGM
jgi:thiosulfate dehydrogenase